MSFTQKTFPQDIKDAAKKLEDGYFIEHLNQTDYFSKGYEAIPSLFKFCFDKGVYLKSINSVDETIKELEKEIQAQEALIQEAMSSTEMDEDIKTEKKAMAEAAIDLIKEKISTFDFLVEFKNSDYTVFDLSKSMKGIPAFFYNEANYSKPVNSFIYKFFDHNHEKTSDFVQFASDRSFSEFIQLMMSKGFIYDKENCIFGKVVDLEGFSEEEISEEHKNRLVLIDEIANFVRANNHFDYLDYVEENQPDIDSLFDEKTLAAYAIAMDKKDFALREISSKKDPSLTRSGQLNDLVPQAMYSIIYRNHKFSDYLESIINKIDFTDKSQEYIDDFVKLTFEQHKKSLSKEIFESYKSKIDNKKLSLALVRDCNVYRLENKLMSNMVDNAFDIYKEDISNLENIVSHFNYYAKSMQMLENISKVPNISIAGNPAGFHVELYMYSVISKIENIEENSEVKYDFWEDDSELRTEEEFLKAKLEKIQSYLSIFGIAKPPSAADYVFSVYRKEDEGISDFGLKGVVVYITPKSFWEENKYMNDQPDETPANYLPVEWQAEDLNESGTWFMVTEETFDEVHQKMLDLGFTFDESFDDLIQSH